MNYSQNEQYTTQDSPVVTVADNFEANSPKPRNVRKRLLVSGLLLLAITCGLALLLLRPNEKIYGRVGDYKVTQSELEKVLPVTTVPQEQVVAALLDRELYRVVASEHDIKVDQSEIDAEYDSRTGGKPIAEESYVRVAVERDIYKKKLSDEVKGYHKGRYVLARFDQNIPLAGIPIPQDEQRLSQQARERLITEDRTYAEALANDLHDKLKSGQLTFDEAIDIQKSDPRLGSAKNPTSPQSGSFNTAEDPDALINIILRQDEPAKILTALKPGDFSAPVIGRVITSEAKDAPTVEGLFVIIQLDAFSPQDGPLGQFGDLSSLESHYKKQLKYRLNT